MRPQTSNTISSVTSTGWMMHDYTRNPFGVTMRPELSTGAALTYTVEHTLEAVNRGVTPTAAQIFDDDVIVGLTASTAQKLLSSVVASRLTITAFTSGDATLKLIQPDAD